MNNGSYVRCKSCGVRLPISDLNNHLRNVHGYKEENNMNEQTDIEDWRNEVRDPKEVLKHFRNPHNMGRLESPDGVGLAGNPVCGDQLTVYIKVRDKKIKEIGFETLGCAAAISTSSVITQLAKGKTIKEAQKISPLEVSKKLGQLPPEKIHCAASAQRALREAI